MEKILLLLHKHFLLVAVVVGLIIYSNSFSNDFVLDDRIQVLGNPIIKSLTNLPVFFTGSTFTDGVDLKGNYYKPLFTTAYSLIHAVFGVAPWGYHSTQILLFSINSWLLYRFLLYFLPKNLALISALIYLVHPINTETAVYIASLQEVLFMFFGLTGFLVYLSKRYGIYNLPITLCLLFLSILSKETGALFFAMLLLHQIIYARKYIIVSLGLSLFCVLLYVFMRFGIANIETNNDKFATIMRIPIEQRLIHIPIIFGYYLYTFVFPKDLVVVQNWVIESPTFHQFYLPLLVSILICVLFILSYKALSNKNLQKSHFLFFTLWFFIGISLHLQIFPLDGTVTDRWFYFPMIGLLACISIMYQQYKEKIKLSPRSTAVLIVLTLVILASRSFVRTFDWRNEYTLSKSDLKTQPDNFVLHNTLGVNLYNQGKLDDAEYHYNKAIKIDPGNNMAWHNLAYLYEKRGEQENQNTERYKKAEEYYQKAIRTQDNVTSYINLSSLRLFKLQYDLKETNENIEQALQKHPKNPNLLVMHAITEQKLGNKSDALSSITKALRAQPTNLQYQQVHYWITNDQDIKLTP